MEANLVLLPGDGIGPEVVQAATLVLQTVGAARGHTFNVTEHAIGGSAIDTRGEPLPEATRAACQQADAVLLGAVGGPRWDDPGAAVRPEQGLLALRKALDLYGNLRPVVPYPVLAAASPLRPAFLAGVNLVVVRELTGGIYFGQPRERRQRDGMREAVDSMVYGEAEIARVAHLAFGMARKRRGKVTSVDKANVLESSRLWREVVTEMAAEYPDVELEHLLVDAAAMHLLRRPASFDVIVTSNLFGDILTDEASMLTGSLGNLPSASLGSAQNSLGYPRGLYEPIHGSAPDIAGQGVANPIGAILSSAMLLRHSLGLEEEAAAIEAAVESALRAGARTADLDGSKDGVLSTTGMTTEIVAAVESRLATGAEERGREQVNGKRLVSDYKTVSAWGGRTAIAPGSTAAASALASDCVWMDGELVAYEDATVPLLSPTLHYGPGVFEGIRCYDTERGPAIFRLEAHLKRFMQSVRILGVRDLRWSLADLRRAVLVTVHANNFKSCYIRPVLYFSDSMGLDLDSYRERVAIAAWEWDPLLGKDTLERGVSMMVSSFTRMHPNASLTKGKLNGQYVNSILAKSVAKRAGFDEAIMLDPEGYVAECTGENLFLVRDDVVYTPPRASVLEGITRDTVMTLLGDLGYQVVEERLSRDQLYIADEVFVCGTAAEVVPVTEIDFRPVAGGCPGPITRAVHALYSDTVRGRAPRSPGWLDYVLFEVLY